MEALLHAAPMVGTLHVGDQIYISEGENEGMALGVLSSGGVQMGTVAIGTSFSSESVFRVHQQHNYTAAKHVRALVESEGRPSIELAAEPAHRRLFAELARERVANSAAFERSVGREIRYGHVIQFEHARTGLMLAVTRQVAHVAKDARQATLEAEAAEAGWFRVMPRLRIHSEGERVRLGNPAILEHVGTGLKLRVERSGKLPDGRREVAAAEEPSSVKLNLYRAHELPAAGGATAGPVPTLLGGTPVRLMHKEADGFLGNKMARAVLGLPVLVAAEDTHVPASSNTMWELQKADVTDGGSCMWAGRVRLVHTASGRCLTVSDETDEAEELGGGAAGEALAGPAGGVWCGACSSGGAGDRGGEAEAPLPVVLHSLGATDSSCLFELVPQYQQREAGVRMDALFRLRHVHTGRWIHFTPRGFERVDGPAAVFGLSEDGNEESGTSRDGSPADSARGSPLRRLGRNDGADRLEVGGGGRAAGGASLSSPLAPDGGQARKPRRAWAAGFAQVTGAAAAGGGLSIEELACVQLVAEAGEPPAGWCGRLVATVTQHDEDVFAVQTVDPSHHADVSCVLAWRAPLCRFIGQFRPHPTPERSGSPAEGRLDRSQVDFSQLVRAVSEMIVFVTRSDNPNPYTREGLPHAHRQLLLQELQMIDLALEAIAAPLRSVFDRTELAPTAAHQRTPLVRACTLCMLLARHALREHDTNKAASLRFVPQLQSMLVLGIRAADTLTQVFVDNEAQLLKVEDVHVHKFVSLLRDSGREAKFLTFLIALCECGGVAIQRNQWRVATALVQQAPELLPDLALGPPGPAGGQPAILISGSEIFFPSLSRDVPAELCGWLDHAEPESIAYLRATLQLYAALATGRNLRNAQLLCDRVPYPLLLQIVSSQALHARHLGVCTAAAAVVRCLYVDVEPHQLMARVKTVRIWDNLIPAAQSGALSTLLTTVLNIDWSRFDALKAFVLGYVRRYETQDARKIEQNRMVLELLRLLHQLLAAGFLKAAEVAPVLPRLLALLDGREDLVDGNDDGGLDDSLARYEPRRTVRLDTLVIIECKLSLCRTLQLLGDMRLDLRLSLLLARYRTEWDGGAWDDGDPARTPARLGFGRGLVADLGGSAKAVGGMLTSAALATALASSGSREYERLQEEAAAPAAAQATTVRAGGRRAAELSRERHGCFDALWSVLAYDRDGSLVPVLMDLTFYQYPPLVSAALALLVRQYEQRSELRDAAAATQLLVKPEMVQLYGTFDQILRELGLLASRRQLHGEEIYTAVSLLGQLVAFCSEEVDEPGADARSLRSVGLRSAGAYSKTRTNRTGRTSAARSGVHTSTDHTEGVYLHLVGRGRARLGSDRLAVNELQHTRPIRVGDRLQVEGVMYWVRAVQPPLAEGEAADGAPDGAAGGGSATGAGGVGAVLVLDKPLALEWDAPVPTELRAGGTGEVWLMLLCYSAGYNLDMQVLLRNLGAHKLALRLLSLPVADKPVASELQTRAVLRAAYRLLKAMASGFAQLQAELVPAIPTFVAHVEKRLVAYDISPTGTISATLKDNRAACALVSVETIRHFVRLASREHAPRFLRFLTLLCVPGGEPVRRNQTLILQALADHEAALLLFAGHSGRAARALLIQADDHVHHPRGRLAYHIELIGLLAALTIGENAAAEGLMRELVPLPELVDQVLSPGLPLALRANYVRLFDEAYLRTAKPVREVALSEELPQLIGALAAELARFVEELPFLNLADELESRAVASYLCCDVLPTLAIYFGEHFPTRRAAADEAASELAALGAQIGDCVLELVQEAVGQEEVLPSAPVARCADALLAAGVMHEPAARQLEAVQAERGKAVTHDKPGGGEARPAAGVERLAPATGHPQERLLEYVRAYADIVDSRREFGALVAIFSVGLDAECEAREAKPGVRVLQRRGLAGAGASRGAGGGGAGSGRGAAAGLVDGLAAARGEMDAAYTRNLLKQLLGGRVIAGLPLDRALTVASLRVLIALLSLPAAQEARRRRRQWLLADEGACSVCLMMCSCADAQLFSLGMRFTIALLEGGNTHVQRAMHAALAAGTVAAFDGSNGSWMGQVKSRLRRGVKEISERKLFVAQQAERRQYLAEDVAGLSAAAAAAVRADIERDFESAAFVAETVEALRLLCEGHFAPMQEYLRDPRGGRSDSSAEPVDLVSEVYSLLAELEPEIDGGNVAQVTACVAALTEFVQGNLSGANTRMLVDSKLPEVLDRLACKLEFGPTVPPKDAAALRAAVATLLLALLEGSCLRAEARLLQVLDLERISEVADESFRLGKAHKAAASRREEAVGAHGAGDSDRSQDEGTLLVESGFALYTLLRHLHDYQGEAAAHSHAGAKAARTVGPLELLSRSGGGEAVGEPAAAGEHGSGPAGGGGGKGLARGMGQYIGRCEIVNAAGNLERVYFRMPDYCLLLTELSKRELLWDVDRETPGKRLQELFERSDELTREMVHQQRLARSPAWQLVMRHKPVADNLVLVLAVAQNCVIVLRHSWTPNESEHLDRLVLCENVANYTMGTLQLCACVLVFCIYTIDRAPLRVWRGFRQATGRGADEILSMPLSRWHASWFLILLYYGMADAQLALLACLSFASVLGLLVSPLWFSVHLLDIVNKSTDLQNVFKAVTLNGRSIAMTALFGATIIYLFAVVGYASAAEVFVLGNYPDEDVPMCTSLFSCFLNALNEGLRSGDIGSFMEPATEADVGGYAFRFAYQLSFWAIVITVLLNIIFGLIIDTFSELRSLQAAIKNHMENTCFICGLDRFTLDTRGPGFDHHVKHEHNMWSYLQLIVYLKQKDPTELNGWEQHVAAKVAQQDASFFPRNRALSVGGGEADGGEAGGEGAVPTVGEQLKQLAETQARMAEALAQLSGSASPSRLTTRASSSLAVRSGAGGPAHDELTRCDLPRAGHPPILQCCHCSAGRSPAGPSPSAAAPAVEPRTPRPASVPPTPLGPPLPPPVQLPPPAAAAAATERGNDPLAYPASDHTPFGIGPLGTASAGAEACTGPDAAPPAAPPAEPPAATVRSRSQAAAPRTSPLARPPAASPGLPLERGLVGMCHTSQGPNSRPPTSAWHPSPVDGAATPTGAAPAGATAPTEAGGLALPAAHALAPTPIASAAATRAAAPADAAADAHVGPPSAAHASTTHVLKRTSTGPACCSGAGLGAVPSPSHSDPPALPSALQRPAGPPLPPPPPAIRPPPATPRPDLTTPPGRVHGWLHKKGEVNPAWRRRFFALAPLELRWWDDVGGFNAGAEPAGAMPLASMGRVEVRPPAATGVTPGRYQLVISPRELPDRRSSPAASGRLSPAARFSPAGSRLSPGARRLSATPAPRWLEIETESVADLERWLTAIRAAIRSRQSMDSV